MSFEQFEVYSGHGLLLRATCYYPVATPRAVVVIFHDLGGYEGRYTELRDHFIGAGIAVFTYDQRGHGHSHGKRGHARSTDLLIEDAEHVLMQCRSLFLDIPILLFGHSMGGQLVAAYLEKVKSKEISGAIISSAWFQLVNPPPAWQIWITRQMIGLVPSFTLSKGLDANEISSVKEEVEVYKNDPLIHDRISISLFHSLYENGLSLINHAEPVGIPVLVCHGENDGMCSPEASRRYATSLGENATFVLWPGAKHDPHHDLYKEKVMDYYVKWVKDRVIKGANRPSTGPMLEIAKGS